MREQWRRTCELWRDESHGRFEHEFWAEYDKTVPELDAELASLGDVLAMARREAP